MKRKHKKCLLSIKMLGNILIRGSLVIYFKNNKLKATEGHTVDAILLA